MESSSQKTRSPIFPCPYSCASSSQVQLHLDTRFLGNSNSPLIRTKSDSLGFTSYIYCKFNFENPKPRSQQCFVAPFLCISLVIPVTASDFMLCLSEIQSPNALRASIFSSCAVPYCHMTPSLRHNDIISVKIWSFYKNLANQSRDVSDLKNRQINGTKCKENFLFNINNSILKKLSIAKSGFSAKVQCSNFTLALKL